VTRRARARAAAVGRRVRARLVVPKVVVALRQHVLLLAPRPVVHRYDAVHDGYLPAGAAGGAQRTRRGARDTQAKQNKARGRTVL
jgi:hypothetical protein